MVLGQVIASHTTFHTQCSRVVDLFSGEVVKAVNQMRQGPPLGHGMMDAGAMTMPGMLMASMGGLGSTAVRPPTRDSDLPFAGLAQKVHALVEDAVAKGAKLLAGGKMPGSEVVGQFYPPTVLLGVRRGMKIWEEEVFGPVREGERPVCFNRKGRSHPSPGY